MRPLDVERFFALASRSCNRFDGLRPLAYWTVKLACGKPKVLENVDRSAAADG